MKYRNRFTATLDITTAQTEAFLDDDIIQVNVEFKIFCPKCGPKGARLVKNGFDRDHKDIPQLFLCKKCSRSFYAQTSWVPKQIGKLMFSIFVNELTKGKVRVSVLAKKFHVSPSLISHIVNHSKEVVSQEIIRAKNDIVESQKLITNENEKLKVIWIDETFFRINRESWCLILAINQNGTPIGWNWGTTRTTQDFINVMEQIDENYPDWNVMVGDGFSVYPKIFKELARTGYLIQHVHSRPWKDVHLHHFTIDENSGNIIQTTITLNYSAFKEEKPQEAFAMTRSFPKSDPNKRIGRPKGSKKKSLPLCQIKP